MHSSTHSSKITGVSEPPKVAAFVTERAHEVVSPVPVPADVGAAWRRGRGGGGKRQIHK